MRRLCDRLNTDRQREVLELRAVHGPGAVLESLDRWPDPGPYCVATQHFNRYLYARLRAMGLADAGGVGPRALRVRGVIAATAVRDCAPWHVSTRSKASATSAAGAGAVWALLADTAGWTEWAGFDEARRTADGAPEPEGVGAHRLFLTGPGAQRGGDRALRARAGARLHA